MSRRQAPRRVGQMGAKGSAVARIRSRRGGPIGGSEWAAMCRCDGTRGSSHQVGGGDDRQVE